MTPIAPHITAFLRQRLPVEQEASRHTTETYTYAFKLLFDFTTDRLGMPPSATAVEQIDAPLVLEFLAHLQTTRGNGARTRNSRLVAIKSFMRFLEHRVPSALDQIHRVLAIPTQRTDIALVNHLDTDQTTALLDAPDATARDGIRDRAMFAVALAGGLRVSELVGIRLSEVTFDGRYVELHIRGKGRRQRVLLLWKDIADAIRAWLAVRGDAPVPELFVNARGQALTRSGFEHILRKHKKAAAPGCPSISMKRVSPHVLRHTCALNTLRATKDIRRVSLWLGHARQETTEIYLQLDPTEKLAAIDKRVLPSLKPGKFRPPDALIAVLMGKSPDPTATPTASPPAAPRRPPRRR